MVRSGQLDRVALGRPGLQEEEAALRHLEEVEHHLAHQERHGAVEVGLGDDALAGEHLADAPRGRHLAERLVSCSGVSSPSRTSTAPSRS